MGSLLKDTGNYRSLHISHICSKDVSLVMGTQLLAWFCDLSEPSAQTAAPSVAASGAFATRSGAVAAVRHCCSLLASHLLATIYRHTLIMYDTTWMKSDVSVIVSEWYCSLFEFSCRQ